MKNTVNIEKIEKVDTELLEQAVLACAEELRKRSLKVADTRCDRDDDEGEKLYKSRHQAYCEIVAKIEGMPKRQKWRE